MAPPVAATQIEEFVTTMHATYKSAQAHPRYSLRSRSLSAIAAGSVLNFISLIIAFISSNAEAPKIVTVIVSIVYSISACYQAFDLLCSPSGSSSRDQPRNIFQHHVPSIYILAIDLLGFLGFLVLLIANGIVVSDLYEPYQLFVYNSVPWMVCCAIHGYIALKTVPAVLSEYSSSQERVYCCAECKRESKRRHGKSDDNDDEDDARTLLLQRSDAGSAV